VALNPAIRLWGGHRLIQFGDGHGVGRFLAFPLDFPIPLALLCGLPLVLQVFGLILRVGQVQAPCARFRLARQAAAYRCWEPSLVIVIIAERF
jgi:hypothetical protein